MKIILRDGRIIPSRKESLEKLVNDYFAKKGLLRKGQHVKLLEKTANSTLRKGELKRFNKSQEAQKEYVVEELKVELAGYTQGDKLTKDGVIAMFDAISKHAAANNYYVGITCDPDRREGEHKAEFLAVIGCPNKDKANELESELSCEGYDAGDAVGNVHKSQSKKVYIYKKTSKTVE